MILNPNNEQDIQWVMQLKNCDRAHAISYIFIQNQAELVGQPRPDDREPVPGWSEQM